MCSFKDTEVHVIPKVQVSDNVYDRMFALLEGKHDTLLQAYDNYVTMCNLMFGL